MNILQIILGALFLLSSSYTGYKAIVLTPIIMRENNTEDLQNEEKAKKFEYVTYILLAFGIISVFLAR